MDIYACKFKIGDIVTSKTYASTHYDVDKEYGDTETKYISISNERNEMYKVIYLQYDKEDEFLLYCLDRKNNKYFFMRACNAELFKGIPIGQFVRIANKDSRFYNEQGFVADITSNMVIDSIHRNESAYIRHMNYAVKIGNDTIMFRETDLKDLGLSKYDTDIVPYESDDSELISEKNTSENTVNNYNMEI